MRELKPKYSIELIEFRTSMGPDIAKLNGYKKVVEWENILPLLREAREFAKWIAEDIPNFQLGERAQAFLDLTAAIEGEKHD